MRGCFGDLVAKTSKMFQRMYGTAPSHMREVTYEVCESADKFRVYACYQNIRIGACVAAGFAPRACCYVFELNVFSEQHQGCGIGTELVRRALEHSGRETVAPVAIQLEAIEWWANRLRKKSFPVKIGIDLKDVEWLRYAAETKSHRK